MSSVNTPSKFDMDLKVAMSLIRDFRLTVVRMQLDPRASRVALKFALKTDDYSSQKARLSQEEDKLLENLAQRLFEKARANGYE